MEEEKPKVKSKKEPEPVEEIPEPVQPEPVIEDVTEEPEIEDNKIYKTVFKKLTGPTVVGKIDLPVEEKKKPIRTCQG